MRFGKRSRERLHGVHSDLVIVFSVAIDRIDNYEPLQGVDLTILEGLRTLERQEKLVAAGASKTLKSRHLTGHAVDVAPVIDGEVRWDWPVYDKVGVYVKSIAEELAIPIEWGGDWRSFKDGPHWQLPWRLYK